MRPTWTMVVAALLFGFAIAMLTASFIIAHTPDPQPVVRMTTTDPRREA